jgi:hypothetical protein
MPAASSPHDRIVTPETDPGRWDAAEIALFRAGKCSYQISDGGWGPGERYCGVPSQPGASFGHCDLHDAEMLVEFWPDGAPRYQYAGEAEADPGYERRIQAAMEAHHRQCTDPDCGCQA